ncbi:LuxR C-terminal-related transcriptional regulator [Pseudomonas aeruginosa]|uniref:LuxR C-terminal-related transcriptional regulator n=1 Tax=Pseudomonas aeruginosa TaxID=287 RepID=UPI001CEFFDE4|nr:LuxR C-terminal-related transcriptional regulator [Pseudomonas aeruginosa]EKV3157310.1 helix-turn-helix transcriptional regulator [Pseudomonas aeruginosa]MDQ4171812.1 LuxR C-terminal-related transcriptional regulator [Pseudomonas aeruginosa]MDQ4191899.1 LuxR C-terminal-related transcriptional regulator [Pseudomonas aeruginosa]MDQ4204102.1 LuxR C-terminal-related transcriptional regulator [Pseudomonas aeruginosa]MDQ4210143.1 LuxR C-terminal-related transcriptional regulator [Pseudomonas aeru
MDTATITAGKWKGRLGMGLAPRELEATLHAASDLTAKEIAKLMGIAPGTVSKRLDDARFKLGAKTIRGLVLEAYKRQIISPLCVGILAILAAAQPFLDEDPAMRARRGGERKIETRLTARRDGVAWVA